MKNDMKSSLAILMGIVIVIADLYWIYITYQYSVDLALGVIIFIAALIWIYLDMALMKKK
jgi:apolipoprotein N-acyltransferase